MHGFNKGVIVGLRKNGGFLGMVVGYRWCVCSTPAIIHSNLGELE